MKLEFRGLLLYFVRKISKTILSWNLLSLCCLFHAINLRACKKQRTVTCWNCRGKIMRLSLNVNTCFFTHLLMIDNHLWMFLTAEILATSFILYILSSRCELNTTTLLVSHGTHTHRSPGLKVLLFVWTIHHHPETIVFWIWKSRVLLLVHGCKWLFFFFPVRVSFKPISLWSQVALYKTCPNILCCNLPQLIENLCNITDTLLSSYLCGPPPFLLCSTMKWNWPQMAGNEVLQWVTILLHVYRALKVFIHCIFVSVKDFSTQHMSKQQVSR